MYQCPECEDNPDYTTKLSCNRCNNGQCKSCSGTGEYKQTCNGCDGNGIFTFTASCNPCQGKGYKLMPNVCRKCKGSKLCKVCNGTGTYLTQPKSCHSCTNGQCKKCSGSGIFKPAKPCHKCAQIRALAATLATSKMTLPCDKCDGYGNFKPAIPCKYCIGGMCKKCNGNGEVQIEYPCRGCSKTGACNKCQGSGKKIYSEHDCKELEEDDEEETFKPKRTNFPVHGDKVMRLYHVTDQDAAKKIWMSKKMLRGSQGMFGGGIYFAESIEVAKYKALHQGYVVIADVFIGKEHTLPGFIGSAGYFQFK